MATKAARLVTANLVTRRGFLERGIEWRYRMAPVGDGAGLLRPRPAARGQTPGPFSAPSLGGGAGFG